MRTFIALLALLPWNMGSQLKAQDQGPSSKEAAKAWLAERAILEKDFVDISYKRVGVPNNPETTKFLDDLNAKLEELDSMTGSPPLPPAFDADKLRVSAFLVLMKYRILKERRKSNTGSGKGNSFPEIAKGLAQTILSHAEEGLKLAQQAADPANSETSPEQRNWMRREKLPGYLQYLKAHGYAILVDEGVDVAANTRKALEAWKMVEAAYEASPPDPADVLAAIIDPPVPPPVTGGMTQVGWIGLGMMTLGLLLPWFTKPKTHQAVWVLRAFVAVGGACLASDIPGILHVEINKMVAAGGAMAVIVILYLLNPPKE
jgi:hypothetical protein